MTKLATAAVVLCFAAACAHSPPAKTGRVQIKGCGTFESDCPQPDDSRVSIDGTFAGLCSDWYAGREIPAGRHRVDVETNRSGRETQDVVVPEGGQTTVVIPYFPMPD